MICAVLKQKYFLQMVIARFRFQQKRLNMLRISKFLSVINNASKTKDAYEFTEGSAYT